MEVRRVDLANWALRISPKFTHRRLNISSIRVFDQIRDPEIPITSRGINEEVRRVDLANWALRTSQKFTTGYVCMYSRGFRARQHLRSLAPVMNDGQMIFGDLGSLKLPDICLKAEKKSGNTSTRNTDPTGDRTQAR